ncbi:hypothetical protein ACFX13_010472 [Malus domestica]
MRRAKSPTFFSFHLISLGGRNCIPSCSSYLHRPSLSSKPSTRSGSDEGLYAWVVANHALGTLGGDPMQTTGIIELGGASAQVTFVSSEPVPPEFSRAVKFGNVTYNLYNHSFLHFGQNVAYDSLKEGIVSGDFDSVLLLSLLTDLALFSSKQCKSFKVRADQVKNGLEKGVPGIKVLLNPDKVYLMKDINVFHGFELMWME